MPQTVKGSPSTVIKAEDLLLLGDSDTDDEEMLHVDSENNMDGMKRNNVGSRDSSPTVVPWPQNVHLAGTGNASSSMKKSSPQHTKNLYEDAFKRKKKLEERRLEAKKLETVGLFQPVMLTHGGKTKCSPSRSDLVRSKMENLQGGTSLSSTPASDSPAKHTRSHDPLPHNAYESMTVDGLTDMCQHLGLDATGRKPELIDRIEDFHKSSSNEISSPPPPPRPPAAASKARSSSSSSVGQQKQQKSPFDRMYERSKLMKARKDDQIRKQHELESNTNTFKPRIYTSPGHRKNLGTTETSGSVFDRLDHSAEVTRQKKKEYARELTEQQCSFSPNLSKPTGRVGGVNNSLTLFHKDSTTQHSSSKVNVKEVTSRLYNPTHLKEVARRKKELKLEYETKECTYQPNLSPVKSARERDAGVTLFMDTTVNSDAATVATDDLTENQGSAKKSVTSSNKNSATLGDTRNDKKKSEAACLRLYQKANATSQKFAKWRKDEADRKVERECTFAPKLTSSSKKAALKKITANGDVFQRLQQRKEKKVASAEDANLTFIPKILKKAVKPGSELETLTKMPLDKRFDRLYQQGVEKIERKRMLPKDEEEVLRNREEEEELKECTFRPKTTWKQVFGHIDDYDIERIDSFAFTDSSELLHSGYESDGRGEDGEDLNFYNETNNDKEDKDKDGEGDGKEKWDWEGGGEGGLGESTGANVEGNAMNFDDNNAYGNQDEKVSNFDDHNDTTEHSVNILGDHMGDHEFDFDEEADLEFQQIKRAEEANHHDFPSNPKLPVEGTAAIETAAATENPFL